MMAASKYHSLVDASWELIDPNPDVHQLFSEFNKEFFWGQLGTVHVDWSSTMISYAGLCKCAFRGGELRDCSIILSQSLLSLRPRKDLVETLLHEMIHAYLFVVEGSRDREGHGPDFLAHMNRINNLTGAKISVYHSFHEEVNYFKPHWWKCNGPCRSRPPFFGICKRSKNQAPGPNDLWYNDHQQTCGGKFVKIKEPEPNTSKTAKRKASKSPVRTRSSTARITFKRFPLPNARNTSTSTAAKTSSKVRLPLKAVNTSISTTAKTSAPKTPPSPKAAVAGSSKKLKRATSTVPSSSATSTSLSRPLPHSSIGIYSSLFETSSTASVRNFIGAAFPGKR